MKKLFKNLKMKFILLLLLVVTLGLTSCVTATKYVRADIPPYPSNIDWGYNEDLKLYTLPQVDLDRLIAWRIEVESI